MAAPTSDFRSDFRLDGRVALVSGAYGGIGFAIAAACLAAGARVVLGGRDLAAAEEAARRLEAPERVRAVRLDTADAGDCAGAVDATLAAFGRLDVLHCVAGINRRAAPETIPEADWDAVLDTNLKGTWLLARAGFEALKAAGDGRIVTVGSILSTQANAVTAPYAASKGGVVQLTRTLAVAWGQHGIKANCLLPGYVETALTDQARRDIPGLDERVRARTTLGRWGKPEDIAGPAVFLASPAAAYLTGAAIPVDGGFTIQA